MTNDYSDNTIVALATPPGESGIAVIRVSGAEAIAAASKIFHPKKGSLVEFDSHTVHAGEIRSGGSQLIDQALVTIFRGPHSYTGEDVVEISSHGSLAITRQILDLLIRAGARHAEPGEFTKRAFLNGKIDLTQAEAVLDLIKSRSEKSAQAAAAQLAGSLSGKLKEIKSEMTRIYAHMEAFLDFPDEHLEVYSDREFSHRIEKLIAELAHLKESFRRGSILREGIKLVIAGKPNVGKSSLFNTLLARDRALVSEYAGTTRDTLDEALEIGGYLVKMTDTAGLAPDTRHPLDALAMERSRQAIQEADIFLYIVDSSQALEPADEEVYRTLQMQPSKPVLTILNKIDLLPRHSRKVLGGNPDPRLRACGDDGNTQNFLRISTKTREGIEFLEKQIAEEISKLTAGPEGEGITRLRHKNAVEASHAAMERAWAAFKRQESLEFVTVDIKTAVDSLRELIGEIYSEDLLDVIFSEFCIGK